MRFAMTSVCVAVMMFVSASALVRADDMAKEAKPAAEKSAGEKSAAPSQDEMMKQMMEIGTPGPEQAQLAKYVGEFTAEVSMWMDPSQPPSKSTGKLKNEMVLGGRYLMGNYEGEFMGKPFHGMSCTGYDKGKKKYFSGWIDDMSTGCMMTEGEADASGKKLTLSGECYCPQTNGMMTMRQVMTMVDDDHMKFEMYGPGPDGKEMKHMEIVYTRVKP